MTKPKNLIVACAAIAVSLSALIAPASAQMMKKPMMHKHMMHGKMMHGKMMTHKKMMRHM